MTIFILNNSFTHLAVLLFYSRLSVSRELGRRRNSTESSIINKTKKAHKSSSTGGGNDSRVIRSAATTTDDDIFDYLVKYNSSCVLSRVHTHFSSWPTEMTALTKNNTIIEGSLCRFYWIVQRTGEVEFFQADKQFFSVRIEICDDFTVESKFGELKVFLLRLERWFRTLYTFFLVAALTLLLLAVPW